MGNTASSCEPSQREAAAMRTSSAPPPKPIAVETVENKIWRKFYQQPLVPIGCAATAYFLVSGIKSFRDRDPVRSQRMMKYRVGAQFVTLLCFMGYVGLDKLDWRLAPMYQDVKKWEQEQDKENK